MPLAKCELSFSLRNMIMAACKADKMYTQIQEQEKKMKKQLPRKPFKPL
jgi:hypothetical protein